MTKLGIRGRHVLGRYVAVQPVSNMMTHLASVARFPLSMYQGLYTQSGIVSTRIHW